jgi:nucleotide-binding universal stress UspA family protein
MYRKILVALDHHSNADQTLLPHVCALARLTGAEVLLVHVADGWVARNYDRLKLAESEEMRLDREYLEATAAALRRDTGLAVGARLALGDPPREILRLCDEEQCDLIAMTTHGHRLIGDILFGSTIDYVRHRSKAPLLIVSPHRGVE